MTKQDLQKVAVYKSLLLKFKPQMTESQKAEFKEAFEHFNQRSVEYKKTIEKTKAKIKEKRKVNPDYARPERERKASKTLDKSKIK